MRPHQCPITEQRRGLPLAFFVGLAASSLAAPTFARPSAPTVAHAGTGASPTAAPSAAARDDDDEARALKRILHLQGGGAMRGIARKNGENWELKQGNAWAPIPARAVRSVELEKDVLARFQKDLRAAFRADEPLAARAETVADGFDAGLYQEALDAAEVILRDHPEHVATRNVLIDRASLFAVPTVGRTPEGEVDFEPVLRYASPASRSLREVCILRLAEAVSDREALRAQLATELHQVLPRRRSFAALAYGRLFPGEEIRPLMIHALRDASFEVRAEAGRALGAAGEPGLALPFVKVLDGSSSPTLRRHAAEALGNAGYRSAVPALVGRLSALASSAAAGANGRRPPHANIFIGRQFAYIQDFDVEVAQLQSVADPQINVLMEGSAFDAGVIGTVEYRHVVASERAAIQRALETITGERPGGRASDWIGWYERQAEASGG